MILFSTYANMHHDYRLWANILGFQLTVATTPGALELDGRHSFLLADLSDNNLIDRMTECVLNWATRHPWAHVICVLNLDTPERVRVLADIVRVTKAECMLRHDGLPQLKRIVQSHAKFELGAGLEQQLQLRLERIAAAPVVEHLIRVAPQHQFVHALGTKSTLRGWSWRLERERQRGLKDLLKTTRLIWAAYLRSQGWARAAVAEYLQYGAHERRRDDALTLLGKPFGLRATDVLDLQYDVLMRRVHELILRPDASAVEDLDVVARNILIESRLHRIGCP